MDFFKNNRIDPLVEATNKLLYAVKIVNSAVEEKKNIILDCQDAINSAQEGINEAKKSLNL